MKTYSTTPKAIASRTARLLSDDLAAKQDAKRKAIYGAKRTETLRHRANEREQTIALRHTTRGVAFAKRFLAKVQHHLSRGRDVGDIAVRENVTVSRVEKAIAEIRSSKGLTQPPTAS